MSYGTWTCTGDGEPHLAQLAHDEALPKRGRDLDGIERCRICGALYLHHSSEVNDWGENGDYYSTTHLWTPVTPAEVERLRADRAWQPDTAPAHRWDSGWRSG